MTQQLSGDATLDVTATGVLAYDTITMTMTMRTPLGLGAQYMANLRSAFAAKYPELIQIVTGQDGQGNPIYASDPAGVVERATVLYWFLAIFSEEAGVQAAAAAKAAAVAALTDITTTVTLNDSPQT
jgi:hypothetical protein